jgi:hypothetical protein
MRHFYPRPLVVKCDGKICYDKKGAVTVKNLREREGAGPLRIYQHGDHWHITHKVF